MGPHLGSVTWAQITPQVKQVRHNLHLGAKLEIYPRSILFLKKQPPSGKTRVIN